MPTSATAARMERLRVTAEEVSAMASYLGVDLRKDEFWLLPIARAAAEEPVPKPWEEMEDDQGNPYFVNPKYAPAAQHILTPLVFLLLIFQEDDGTKADVDGICRCNEQIQNCTEDSEVSSIRLSLSTVLQEWEIQQEAPDGQAVSGACPLGPEAWDASGEHEADVDELHE